MNLTEQLKKDILRHAHREHPRECCGLIVNGKYEPCRNIADGLNRFHMEPQDQARAELHGEVEAVVHSHINIPPQPSMADKTMMSHDSVPWVIVNLPNEEFQIFYPEVFIAPLIGREFSHGVNDCYTLIRDYFLQELKLDLPDFARVDGWWQKGCNLYVENFKAAGFRKVDGPPQKHDVIIMSVASSVPNHGAIYLGGGVILHHVANRLSRREVYKGYWERNTRLIVRHESL